MTRAEAIEILKKLIEAMQGHVTVLPTPERIAAIRLAIASLETDEAYQLEYEKPTAKNDLGVDCISRADAIRVASGYCHPSNVAKELAKLPSVTPQEPILDKIRAEIKHFMYDINPSSSESDYACNYILQIIDKYKAETEG